MDITNYLAKPAPEMLGDLTAAHTAEQDRRARQLGFKSHADMLAAMARNAPGARQDRTADGRVIVGNGGATLDGQTKSWTDWAGDASDWHPAKIFQRVADTIRGATQ